MGFLFSGTHCIHVDNALGGSYSGLSSKQTPPDQRNYFVVVIFFFYIKVPKTIKYKEILSVESQKGAIIIQRCSVENQKGAIAVQCYGDNALLAQTIQTLG